MQTKLDAGTGFEIFGFVFSKKLIFIDNKLQVGVVGSDQKLERTPIINGHIPIHHTDAIYNSIELFYTKYGPIPNTNTT